MNCAWRLLSVGIRAGEMLITGRVGGGGCIVFSSAVFSGVICGKSIGIGQVVLQSRELQ